MQLGESESFAKFRRTVNDRYQAFRTALDSTLATFGAGNDQQRQQHTEQLVKAGIDLHDILSNEDVPVWLNPILNSGRKYLQQKKSQTAQEYLVQIAKFYYSVGPIKIVEDVASPYDFDKLYERLRAERRIPELFDTLVEKLTEIIESGEVDSVTVLESLKQMVSVLRANRDASYLATVRSFDYVKFVSKFIVAALKRIPGVKEAVEAYQETIKDMDGEFEKLNQDYRDEMQKAVVERLPNLKRLPELMESQHPALPPPDNAEGDKLSDD